MYPIGNISGRQEQNPLQSTRSGTWNTGPDNRRPHNPFGLSAVGGGVIGYAHRERVAPATSLPPATGPATPNAASPHGAKLFCLGGGAHRGRGPRVPDSRFFLFPLVGHWVRALSAHEDRLERPQLAPRHSEYVGLAESLRKR